MFKSDIALEPWSDDLCKKPAIFGGLFRGFFLRQSTVVVVVRLPNSGIIHMSEGTISFHCVKWGVRRGRLAALEGRAAGASTTTTTTTTTFALLRSRKTGLWSDTVGQIWPGFLLHISSFLDGAAVAQYQHAGLQVNRLDKQSILHDSYQNFIEKMFSLGCLRPSIALQWRIVD